MTFFSSTAFRVPARLPRPRMLKALQLLLAVGAMALSAQSFAANYPLELVSPRASGSSPSSGAPAIAAANRIFKAYPGIEYNIRAVVTGGAYPYTFAISNAPAGMTINSRTGEIRWPSPSGSTASPTISVTDAEGTQASSPWTIAVTTAGFKFVDAAAGSSGDGSINSPFRSATDMLNASSSVRGDIVYFRNGTYNVMSMPHTSAGGPWERVEIESNKPNMWIAYPGATPVIDFGFNSSTGTPGVLIRFDQTNMYIDGFETRNSRIIGLQVEMGNYGVIRRMRFRDLNLIRANLDGTNSSFIMTTTGNGAYGNYLAIQDNDFANAPADMAMKIYSQRKLVIENNTLHDLFFGIELKSDMPQFTYRANRHYNIPGRSIGGNMHVAATSGEIAFNLVTAPTGEFALDINQDGMASRIDIYRNTFLGRVRVRNTDGADGPFRFYNNVIINNDSGTPAGSHVYYESVSDPSRVTHQNNLTGNANGGITDASGLLTSTYSQYVGTRGHQVGAVPRAPTNLTAQ